MSLALREAPIVLCLVLLVLGFFAAFPADAVAQEVTLDNDDFQFVDADETTAFFRWSVDVVDNSGEGVRVRVILELLDEDDRVVNRDTQGRNSDAVTVTIAAGEERRTVNQQGRIAYDLAANVVEWRVRWELVDVG